MFSYLDITESHNIKAKFPWKIKKIQFWREPGVGKVTVENQTFFEKQRQLIGEGILLAHSTMEN